MSDRTLRTFKNLAICLYSAMELAAVIVLSIFGTFALVIGTYVFRSWQKAELNKESMQYGLQRDQEIQALHEQLTTVTTQAKNFRYQLGLAKKGRDVVLTDDELLDPDEDLPQEEKLSTLIESIYPQLPSSIKPLIDKPEIQELAIRKLQESPDIVGKFIDRFTKPQNGHNSTPPPKSYAI